MNADVFLPSFSSFALPSMPSVESATTDARGRLLVDGALQSLKMPGVFAVRLVESAARPIAAIALLYTLRSAGPASRRLP